MGISTLASYKAAQIFEIVGLNSNVTKKCFMGTASRIEGVGFETLGADALALQNQAYGSASQSSGHKELRDVGEYAYRNGQAFVETEVHMNDPEAIAKLQAAARGNDREAYRAFSAKNRELSRKCTIRGMMRFKEAADPVPLEAVEPAIEIVKRSWLLHLATPLCPLSFLIKDLSQVCHRSNELWFDQP